MTTSVCSSIRLGMPPLPPPFMCVCFSYHEESTLFCGRWSSLVFVCLVQGFHHYFLTKNKKKRKKKTREKTALSYCNRHHRTTPSTTSTATKLMNTNAAATSALSSGGAPGSSTTALPVARGVEYRCGDCGTKTVIKGGDPIRCRQCGFRILYKTRTKRCKFCCRNGARISACMHCGIPNIGGKAHSLISLVFLVGVCLVGSLTRLDSLLSFFFYPFPFAYLGALVGGWTDAIIIVGCSYY